MVLIKKCISSIPILWLRKDISNSFCVRNISNRAVARRFEMVLSDFTWKILSCQISNWKILRDISNCVVCQITAQFESFLSERHFQNHTSFNWTSFTVMHWTTKYTWVILTLKIEYKIARTWCTLFWVTPYIFENSLHTKSQPPTLLRSGLNLFWQTKLTITQSHILRQHAAA